MSAQNPITASHSRNRLNFLIFTVLTITLGLASRRYPIFPTFFGKYPGDILWALMVFLLFATILHSAKPHILAALSAGFSLVIELLKLIPALGPLRENPYGHLVFGSVFSWENLVAYAIGIALGVILDRFIMQKT